MAILKFPEKPISFLRLKLLIRKTSAMVKKEQKWHGLETLMGIPSVEAVAVWQKLIKYNPNNLGNWSIKEIEPDHQTAFIERELIGQMINLYHGDKDQIEGYVTSGGTEANIFSVWLGRNFLEKQGIEREKIILIKTSLAHYSLEKAANLIGVKNFSTPLNEKTWGIDPGSFEKDIRKLIKQGFKGFLVPLTLGYTLTGTFDPPEEICGLVKSLKKDFQGVDFFLWLDAAINGLIEPFLNSSFCPFAHSEIKTFLTDFHKFGSAPIPSGLILYRKKLRKLIERPIDYLNEKDNTLLGSRSGIAPVACWAVINRLGKAGFKKMILKRVKKRNDFIKKYQNKKELKFIANPSSFNCGIMIKKKADRKGWEENFGLKFREIEINFSKGKKKFIISKAFF